MSKELIVIRQVAKVTRVIRGEKVLLDFDLAPLYGVTTGNKAMRRNRERFPSDFMFQLTAAEAESLIFHLEEQKVVAVAVNVPTPSLSRAWPCCRVCLTARVR
jgi:ORF6N domain-containing protein